MNETLEDLTAEFDALNERAERLAGMEMNNAGFMRGDIVKVRSMHYGFMYEKIEAPAVRKLKGKLCACVEVSTGDRSRVVRLTDIAPALGDAPEGWPPTASMIGNLLDGIAANEPAPLVADAPDPIEPKEPAENQ